MKIYHNKRHIKTVPKKFNNISNITDHLEDFENKRLTENERNYLNTELTKLILNEFSDKKKKSYKLKQILKDAHPETAIEITTREKKYWVIKFTNGAEILCSHKLFNQSPQKKKIKRLY